MIKVRDISFKYNNLSVLENISFDIPKGSWLTIIGENGSGKSTLAKLMVGLLLPYKGSIHIDDIKVSESNNDIRKKIGIIFQNPDNQFVGITVRHDIAFWLENKRVPRNEMEEIVNNQAQAFGLMDIINKEPANLSGGQKQKVAIAGALISDVDYMIFDESTSMLDPIGVKVIISEMKRLHSLGKTIIHITHDISLATLGTDIMILYNKKISSFGPVKEILLDPKNIINANLALPKALELYYNVINPKIKEKIWEYIFAN